MNTTRWIFVALIALALGYEVVAAVQHKGNTVSEMAWDLFQAEPAWKYGLIAMTLHLVLGQRTYQWFLGLFH